MSQDTEDREGYDPKATALGAFIALTVILVLTKTPALVEKYPSFVRPIAVAFAKPENIFRYVWWEAPLKLLTTSGIIAIFAGAVAASILASARKAPRSSEGAGYAVYWYSYFTIFPDRPGIIGIVLSMFFLYGFMGFFFGSFFREMKKSLTMEE